MINGERPIKEMTSPQRIPAMVNPGVTGEDSCLKSCHERHGEISAEENPWPHRHTSIDFTSLPSFPLSLYERNVV